MSSPLQYFVELFARRHGQARRRVRGMSDSLLEWGRRYLPDHFKRPPSKLHLYLSRRLGSMHRRRGTRLNVLAPRGSAKSTLVTLAYVLRAALCETERYIWILSDTKPQAIAHLENIRLELEENLLLRAEFPAEVVPPSPWRANRLVLGNGAAIEAFGTGQRIRGKRRRDERPTLIVCDDLQNDDHILSAARRQKGRTWFHGSLLKAGTPKTNVINLATALHREALALELCRTPGWEFRIFKSIVRYPARMDLWEAWEERYAAPDDPSRDEAALAFFEANRKEMTRGAAVLWPEVEDLYALMRLRAEGGAAAFEREKQNSPVNPELCEWPERYFDAHVWFEAWPNDLRLRAIAIDPSKGADSRLGDFSAIVYLGVGRDGRLYVEAELVRLPVPEMIAAAVDAVRRFRPDIFGVEANQFQSLLADEMQRAFRASGMLAVRPALIENRDNKLVRIRRLGPYLAARLLRFHHPTPGTRLLVDQLRMFPIADHDDGPDALEMAVRLAQNALRPALDDRLGGRLV